MALKNFVGAGNQGTEGRHMGLKAKKKQAPSVKQTFQIKSLFIL